MTKGTVVALAAGGVLFAVIAGPGLAMAGAVAAVVGDHSGGESSGWAQLLPTTQGSFGPTPPPGTMTEIPPTALLPGVPSGGYPTGTYQPGECTYWAALNHRVTWKADAYEWAAGAAASGAALSHVPSYGAIVVYAPGDGYNPEFGHVAVVVAVGSSAYTVTEMNVLRPGSGAVDERTIAWPDAHVEAFIP